MGFADFARMRRGEYAMRGNFVRQERGTAGLGDSCCRGEAADLEDFLAAIGRVPNELALHCMLFIAGKKGWLHHPYKFCFNTNVPFSPDLGDDLFVLEARGVLKDTRQAGFLVYAGTRVQPPVTGVLAELASMNVEDLLLLSRIVYAEEKFVSSCVEDSAVHLFGLSREVVRPGIAILRDLENKAQSG